MCDIKQLIIKKHIKHLALDSRQVKPNSLFIALKGSKFDGRLRKYKRREKKEKSSEMIEKQKDKLYDVQLEAYRKKTFILRLFTKKPKRLL